MDIWKILKRLGQIYFAVLGTAIVCGIFVAGLTDRSAHEGCRVYDAMLVGFKCEGFAFSELVGIFLNLPVMFAFSPIFALFSLRGFVSAILLWVLPILFTISIIKLRSQNPA